MILIFKKILFLFFLSLLFFLFKEIALARSLIYVSDTVSSSWPSVAANHLIKFKTTRAIPAGGKILIAPETGSFTVEPGLDYQDLDFATSTDYAGPFAERSLAAVPNAVYDGVSTSGGSTSTVITIDLNTSFGVAADTFVQLKIGTNAIYEATSTRRILNPLINGSYEIYIETQDQNSLQLERAYPMMAVIDQVTTTTTMPKVRSHGSPSGSLSESTTETIMSLNTNFLGTCRYSTASGTAYSSMTNTFSYTGAYYHSNLMTGLTPGSTYEYFIRCRDTYGQVDTTDYVILFYIDYAGAGEGEGGSGDPGPGGGGSGETTEGSGSGGGGGSGSGNLLPYEPLPENPDILFKGLAYPGSTVYVTKDGADYQNKGTDSGGVFTFELSDFTKGMYTFGIWAQDSLNRKSSINNNTFFVEPGTQTSITDIFISPTIALNNSTVDVGQSFEIVGQGAVNSKVEAWLYPSVSRPLRDSDYTKASTTVAANGTYSIIMNTTGMVAGQYKVKTRSVNNTYGESDFSPILNIGIGEAVKVSTGCPNGDLNQDGKVNITDFSILLYYWGTDNTCADQNSDGTVNLTDFSILMYYWTG